MSNYFWHFTAICIIVFLSEYKNSLINRGKMWNLLLWGVFFVFPHEFAHWIIAMLTNGKPFGFSIVPKKRLYEDINGNIKIIWDFGSVQAYVNFYNALLIGLAPLLLLVLAYFVYTNFFNFMPYEWWSILFFYIIIYILVSNSIPSTQDIKVAFSQNSFIFYAIIIGIIYFVYHIKEIM